MIFEATPLHGVYVVEPVKREDHRGFFARLFCDEAFAERGLETRFVQANTSLSRSRGTLRGLHYQYGEAAEVKLVRCAVGALYDVALDLRPDSPSFGRSFGVELQGCRMLYVPRGCAHGFVTLSPNTEVHYMVSTPHARSHERTVRYDDPRFAVSWPLMPEVISEKDLHAPDFDPAHHHIETLRGLL
jgi:dTDP-4-dehydrorhamnose 3,5-epimerase